MKTKSYYFKLKLSLILSILLLIFATNKIPFSLDRNLQSVKLDDIQSSDINFVNPIFINDTDPAYNWSKTAADNDWCSGSGSWSDPYVIENITINGNSASNCIDIQNSNKYFIIKNCTVYNSSIGHDFAGITLENVNNSLTFDNNCSFNNGHGIRLINTYNNTILHNLAKSNTWEGIFLRYSANNTVRNNTVGNNHRGIRVSNCVANNIIDNNSVYGNSDSPMNSAGIGIYFSQNTTITRNNVFNNTKGIYFAEASNITLKGNNISNSEAGIYMEFSNTNIKFIDNIISNCDSGIRLNGIQESIVRNNTFLSCENGIDIQNTNNISIYDNNIINCSSGGITFGWNSYNITVTRNNFSNCEIYLNYYLDQISTYNITKSNLINGKSVYFYTNKLGLTAINFSNPGQIILFNCNNSIISNFTVVGGINLILCKNNTITENIIQAKSRGLNLNNCYNITIFNNTVFDSEFGIWLYSSTDCNISENKILNSYFGVDSFDCHNNTFHENIMDNNQVGFALYYSTENNITKNSINNNLWGIAVISSSYYNNIYFNDLVNNSEDGIFISSSSNNTMFGNFLVNNIKAGLRIDSSSNENLIYNNSFIGNALNAQDNGTNNQWDDGVIGNFWDDYSGKDANDDGKGDTSYTIPGSASSQDNYPIFWDPPIISIDSPTANATFSNIAPGYEISLEGIPQSMWYTIEGVIGSFNITELTGTIDQDTWDSLDDGEITITFYAQDSESKIGSTSIIVIKSTPSTDGIPGYNLFVLFGVLSVVAIIISTKLKKFNN